MDRLGSAARRLVALSLLVNASLAFAHHPMDGQAPVSFLEGLLSGLGHPLIEPAHALFLLGAAVMVAVTRASLRRALALLVLHVLASTLGTVLTLPLDAPAAVQGGLAVSLVLLTPSLWMRRLPAAPAAWLLAAATGVAHGLAFGEAVIGAEQAPVFAYLAGLAIMQCGVLVGLCIATRRLVQRTPDLTGIAARTLASGLLAGSVVVASGAL